MLTIYYTTIDGHAPSLPPPSARRGRRGRPGRDGITTRGRRRGRWDALDAPDHHHQRQPWGNVTPWTRWITLPPAPAAVAEGTPWTRRDHPPAPAAVVEGMPLTCWITPTSASTARGRHRVFSNPIYSPADFFTKIRIGGRAHRHGLLPGYREAAQMGRL
nr:MAG TPA: hypothetical protein [Caudoviricetes sp.]